MSTDHLEFTEEETRLAVTQEENERLRAENERLTKRVVMLRVLVNRSRIVDTDPENTEDLKE